MDFLYALILSVAILYANRLLKDIKTLKRVVWVFLPTAALGFVLYKFIKTILLGNLLITALALLIGGILIIVVEKYFTKNEGQQKITDLLFKNCLLLGVI